jgi:hypothetical protein
VLKKGQLVRWIVDYAVFEAYDDSSMVRGVEPIYKYGIIMEVGTDETTVVICCYEKTKAQWMMLNMIHDKFEILSG